MNVLLNITIDEILRKQIVDFVYDTNNNKFFTINPRGINRKYCVLNRIEHNLNEEIKLFSQKCFSHIGIDAFKEETMYGNFIGVNSTGAFVHEHKDPTIKNSHHVRMNFLVQKPLSGGMPVIDGKEYTIEQGQAWINIASSWKHKSTPVVGDSDRIVLSLGAIVAEDNIKHLRQNIEF